MARPTGVTIIAALSIIGGILGLIGSLGLLGIGGAAAAGGAAVGGLGIILGGGVLISAILSLVFGYGAWTLKSWAWIWGVASQILSLVFALIAIVQGNGVVSSIIGMIIPAIILYYLNTPLVKRAFGRA